MEILNSCTHNKWYNGKKKNYKLPLFLLIYLIKFETKKTTIIIILKLNNHYFLFYINFLYLKISVSCVWFIINILNYIK